MVETPPLAPVTSTRSPATSPPRVARPCQAVTPASAAAAAVSSLKPSGSSTRLAAGATAYSAKPPCVCSPMISSGLERTPARRASRYQS